MIFEIKLEENIPLEYSEDIVKQLYLVDDSILNIKLDKKDLSLLLVETKLFNQQTLSSIKSVAQELIKNFILFPAKIVFEHKPLRDSNFTKDPYDLLLELGLISPVGIGRFVYSGFVNKLLVGLDRFFREKSLAFRVDEYYSPAIIDLSVLKKVGYLDGFLHNANIVSHVCCQQEKFPKILNLLKETDDSAEFFNNSEILIADSALSPAVCYHFYKINENKTLKSELIGGTSIARCFRHEGQAMQGLTRLREFLMREIVFIGSMQEIKKCQNLFLSLAQDLIKYFNLEAMIRTASDPFFIDTYDKKRVYQISFNLKHELQACLPFNSKFLAIGSVNYHQDHFGKAFNILLPDGSIAHSCCVGFGLDRWIYVLCAQFGIDIDNWPKNLKDIINER